MQLFKKKTIIFYCADPLDYEMFLPIKEYLPTIEIVAKNRKTKKYLIQKRIPFKLMPQFPKLVIMARHEAFKFPVNKIIKIGFDHGLYQFKKWTSPKNYNQFNVYFVSSENQVETAKKMGINTTKAIGYPKLDKAFNGTYNNKYLEDLREKIGINDQKKTIIFTSTWDIEGLSAITKWIDNVHVLTNEYNILLTVHTWTSEKHLRKLREIKNAYFIEEYDVTPYLIIADIFVGDYNSLIGEFCAFNKPIITFSVPQSKKSIPEVREMIKSISYQINDFDEIFAALKFCTEYPKEKYVERQKTNDILFYKLDGLAGKRAADIIEDYLSKMN